MEKGKRRSAGPGRGVEGEAEDREVAAGADQREWERKRRPARPRRSGGRERPLVRRQGRGGLGSTREAKARKAGGTKAEGPLVKAAKRWAEAAEAARKEDLLRAKMCSLRHFRTRRCFSIREGREGEAGNRGEALAAAQKAKAEV